MFLDISVLFWKRIRLFVYDLRLVSAYASNCDSKFRNFWISNSFFNNSDSLQTFILLLYIIDFRFLKKFYFLLWLHCPVLAICVWAVLQWSSVSSDSFCRLFWFISFWDRNDYPNGSLNDPSVWPWLDNCSKWNERNVSGLSLFSSASSFSSSELTRIRSVTWIAPALNASLCVHLTDEPSPHVVSSSAPSAVTPSWKSWEARAKVSLHQPCLNNIVCVSVRGMKILICIGGMLINWEALGLNSKSSWSCYLKRKKTKQMTLLIIEV